MHVAPIPNSIAAGCPMHSSDAVKAFSSVAENVDGAKIRQQNPSVADHFSQATLFWNSMAHWEKKHIVDAFSFELNMVQTQAIRERFLNELLAIAQRVGKNIGIVPRRVSPWKPVRLFFRKRAKRW